MFIDIEIEPTPGFGFIGGPEFQTTITALANGREARNIDWSTCRHKYTAPFKNIPNDAYLAIKKVFMLCRGKAHTFKHRDWGDFSATAEVFGTGDGTTLVFQLSKVSESDGFSYTRIVTKPDDGVTIKVAGVTTAAVVSALDGTVTFSSAPASGAQLTWTGEFFVQVRFDIDYLPFSLDDKSSSNFITNGSIDLIEYNEP